MLFFFSVNIAWSECFFSVFDGLYNLKLIFFLIHFITFYLDDLAVGYRRQFFSVT
jgi:hypothetical protein